jgi:hypothetical protein
MRYAVFLCHDFHKKEKGCKWAMNSQKRYELSQVPVVHVCSHSYLGAESRIVVQGPISANKWAWWSVPVIPSYVGSRRLRSGGLQFKASLEK